MMIVSCANARTVTQKENFRMEVTHKKIVFSVFLHAGNEKKNDWNYVKCEIAKTYRN